MTQHKTNTEPATTHFGRPMRLRMADFAGQMCTLQGGAVAYSRLDAFAGSAGLDYTTSEPTAHMLCGLGSLLVENAATAVPHKALLNPDTLVYVLECEPYRLQAQDFLQKQGYKAQALPAHWQCITAQEALHIMRKHSNMALWWHGQNTRLFPQYWYPVQGKLMAHGAGFSLAEQVQGKEERAQVCGGAKSSFANLPIIFLGSTENQLLTQELETAFTALGFTVQRIHEERSVLQRLQALATNASVSLFFSVNLQGLDAEGQDVALLQALGIPVAVWFVDNPWHVLAALRLPWWKHVTLLLTDASFMQPLQQEGAEKVLHMPLATAQHMWQGKQDLQHAQERNDAHLMALLHIAQRASCIFVGRAAFPAKEKFFAAARVPQQHLLEAQQLLEQNDAPCTACTPRAGMPHFHWWAQALKVHALWPQHAVRNVGLGAEESAQYQRVLWLKAACEHGLALFGDALLWQKLLPSAAPTIFHPEVDYYTQLAPLYAAAPAVLNVTSLLLPEGLTQRHFDVWAAGGFLWSNYTKGLDIFPAQLVKEMSFTQPNAWRKAEQNMTMRRKEDMQQAWQEELRQKHSYVKRLGDMLAQVL